MSVKIVLIFLAVGFCVAQEQELSSRDKRTIELLLNQFANVLGYQVVPKARQPTGFSLSNLLGRSSSDAPRNQDKLQYPRGPFSLPNIFSLSQQQRAAKPPANTRSGPLQIALPIPTSTTTTEATTSQEATSSSSSTEPTTTSTTTEAPQTSTEEETLTEMITSSQEQSTEEMEMTSQMTDASSTMAPIEESAEIFSIAPPASPFLESRAFALGNGQNSNPFITTNHLGETRTSTHFGNNLTPFGFARSFVQNAKPDSRFRYFPDHHNDKDKLIHVILN